MLLLLAALSMPFKGLAKKGTAATIATIGFLVALYFTTKLWGMGEPSLFFGLFTIDTHALFFKIIFIVTALAIVVFSQNSCKLSDNAYEYYALITGLLVGMNLLASTHNILMLYVALEFTSLMSYLLVGFAKNSNRSSEAALKYVLFGAVASGFFLFGASLFYGFGGTLNISSLQFEGLLPAPLIIAGIFMLGGFLYKIAAVPMQAWCPDAYEGAPTPIAALLSVAPKAAGFAVLMRVTALIGAQVAWPTILAVVSALTMTLGNLAAIPQTSVKRLLAYSSIAHAGYLLMGIACFSVRGNEAIYFYFIAYLLMNLGAFLVTQIVSDKMGSDNIESFRGLGRGNAYGAFLAIMMTIFLLSLTGVPPFVGFIGKFYLFTAVVDAKLWWLALVGIINSVISLYYYMRIVVAMFFNEKSGGSTIAMESVTPAFLLFILAFFVIVFGLAWGGLARLVSGG